MLVHDDNHPYSLWKLACVKELLTSSDGVVQGALLLVSTTWSILRRPMQAIYPLEIHASDPDYLITKNNSNVDNSTGPSRPLRIAAKNAQQR